VSETQKKLDQLAARLRAHQPQPKPASSNGHSRPPLVGAGGVTDEAVIQKCRAAENAAKFSDLFHHGDVHVYHDGDESRADLSLLGILTFYTQDEAQLERIFSSSALGRREKWRRRDDYRKRTIRKALSEAGEPKEREYLIEKIGVKGYPIVAFGAGGVAKSFAMLSAGIAVASGVEEWLGLRVLEHGYVLYLDFELDVEEQHRRVRDLCAGMGIMIPKKLAYLSGVGISPDKAFEKALQFVKDYEAKAVIIDSMGLAMQGDMEKGKEVLAFHGRYVNPLRRAGATPFIVDHEGKLQAGEKHKDKTPFGSAYKAWASRSVLQFVSAVRHTGGRARPAETDQSAGRRPGHRAGRARAGGLHRSADSAPRVPLPGPQRAIRGWHVDLPLGGCRSSGGLHRRSG
jgi:hypothetical protein